MNPLFLEALLPAMIIFAIYSAAILGLPDPLVQARDSGHLPQLQDQRRAPRSTS
jgi:hypothetical protein